MTPNPATPRGQTEGAAPMTCPHDPHNCVPQLLSVTITPADCCDFVPDVVLVNDIPHRWDADAVDRTDALLAEVERLKTGGAASAPGG